MARLIDADRLKSWYAWWEDEGEVDEKKRLFDAIVDQQETVEHPQVIHCADCRYFGAKYRRCALFGCDKMPEGFCDEAVKRTAQ